MAVWFVGCLAGQKGPPSRAQIAERAAKVYLVRGNFGRREQRPLVAKPRPISAGRSASAAYGRG